MQLEGHEILGVSKQDSDDSSSDSDDSVSKSSSVSSIEKETIFDKEATSSDESDSFSSKNSVVDVLFGNQTETTDQVINKKNVRFIYLL